MISTETLAEMRDAWDFPGAPTDIHDLIAEVERLHRVVDAAANVLELLIEAHGRVDTGDSGLHAQVIGEFTQCLELMNRFWRLVDRCGRRGGCRANA